MNDFLGRRGGLAVPLQVGDAWGYGLRSSLTLVTAEGPQPPEVSNDELRIELTGTQTAAGREYVVQTETWTREGGSQAVSTWLYRQDRSGLYVLDQVQASLAAAATVRQPEAAIARVGPAQRDAFRRASAEVAMRMSAVRDGARGPWHRGGPWRRGGPQDGEITMLRYPFFIGARWTVRDDPFFGRLIEGREGLELPAGAVRAWRLGVRSEVLGPNDRAHLWYSRVGFVQLAFHFESEATDASGNVIGKVIGEQRQELRSVSLVGSGSRLLANDEVTADDR